MDAPASIPLFRIDVPAAPARGVRWVLRKAAAAATIALALVILLEFGYRVSAEASLQRAAKAGLREAALPRANRASIERAIRGRLDTRLNRGTRIVLQANGANRRVPVSILLTAPADSALPDWLELVTVWNSSSEITTRVGG